MTPPPTPPYTLSLHDALPISTSLQRTAQTVAQVESAVEGLREKQAGLSTSIEQSEKSFAGLNVEARSEEHTSELQSRGHLVCRLLLEKKKKTKTQESTHTINT